MKLIHVLAIAASVLVLSFCSSACAGSSAKTASQFPAAELAWPGVEGDFLRGLDDGIADGELATDDAARLRVLGDQLEAALDGHDSAGLRLIPWSGIMRPWADRGIDDKVADLEIGPTVAESLHDRVVHFTATIDSLQRIYQ